MALLRPFKKCLGISWSRKKYWILLSTRSIVNSTNKYKSSSSGSAKDPSLKTANVSAEEHSIQNVETKSAWENFSGDDFSSFAERYDGHIPDSNDIKIIPVNEVLKDIAKNKTFENMAIHKSETDTSAYVPAKNNSSIIFKEMVGNKTKPVKAREEKKSLSKKNVYIPIKKKKILLTKKNSFLQQNHITRIDKQNDVRRKQVVPKSPSPAKLLSSSSKFTVFEAFKEIDKKTEDSSAKDVGTIENCVNFAETSMFRKNCLGIQILSDSIYQQIFSKVSPKCKKEAEEDFLRSKAHLEEQKLWGKEPSTMPDYDIDVPSLEGSDLEEHFYMIAEEQCSPYKELLNKLVGADILDFPDQWQYAPGWTRYNSDGTHQPVDYPECSALVFDVEVCVKEGKHPILAAAVSDKYWYSWCSRHLISDSNDFIEITKEDLIPLGNPAMFAEKVTWFDEQEPRVVVGHNVSYDRIRVMDEYQLEGSSLRFVDTMSLHIAVSGLVSEQRSLMLKNKSSDTKVKLPWMSVGCQNNLNDVYKFYCKVKEDLKKDTRNVFVKGSLKDVRTDFQNLMTYCANDVKATHKVLTNLLPMFFSRFPHPVTFSGMLEMGSTFLPVTDNWIRYVDSAEIKFRELERLLNEELVRQAQEALKLKKNDAYKRDPWLWDLDWSVPKGKVKTLPGYPNWYRKLCAKTGEREGTPEPENMSTSLHVVPKILRLTWNGYPLHYERKYGWGYLKPLYEDVDDSRSTKVPDSDQQMLEMNNQSFPVDVLQSICTDKTLNLDEILEVRKNRQLDTPETADDWLLLLSSSVDNSVNSATKTSGKKVLDKKSSEKENLVDIGLKGVAFVPLPHKDGPGNRVGNPLAKDFLNKIEDNTLSSYHGDIAKLVLKTNKTLSYWKNNRDRILSQMVIWNASQNSKEQASSSGVENSVRSGAILPMVVTAGTITRRAVEPTWMTASNAYVDRIGSELKSMVEAPSGYNFVGADVDSQELWIAAVLGDAYFSAEHGATSLGWMTLQGKKSDGSDMHSRTADMAGISRDHAKVINYGRIYGAGVKFTQRLLKQFNPKQSDAEAQNKAFSLFEATKGKKGWLLNEKGEMLVKEINFSYTGEALSRNEVNKLLRQAALHEIDASFGEVVDGKPVWVGGSESHMFNCLEAIARSETPKTPVLGAHMTRALEPKYVEDQFMTSRVNWVVQSSAVDYLHLMLVSMKWLFKKYGITGRFCISIHDEVRYLVASEDRYRAALALQITNLLTRSLFAIRLGFKDLPQSVAFFSSVDIDRVMRKEPHLDCVTPSNPNGLSKGYGIPPGESLNIEDILEITKGKLDGTSVVEKDER